MAFSRPASRQRLPATSTAACCLALAASGLLWAAAPTESFVNGIHWATNGMPSSGRSEPHSSSVVLRASGPVPYDTRMKVHPKGYRKSLMKKMPDSRLDTEEIMKRITTILLKNMEEKFRDAPMKTKDLMKDIGLRGPQIKTKRFINDALFLLMAQKVIHKVKQNPIRWEIHEEYRKYGVPPISREKRAPWRLTHLLKFKRTKVPKYGPIHGLYRPQDREFLKSRDLPLSSIYDPIIKVDPYQTGNLDDLNLHPPKPQGPRAPLPKRLPVPPKDADGEYVQFDWELEQKL